MFKPLLAFKIDNEIFDVHNDFICVEMRMNIRLIFTFKNEEKVIYLIFANYQICEIPQPFTFTDKETLANFYRGRYEITHELRDEYQERQCFYLHFEKTLCVLAKNAYFWVNTEV